MGQDQSHAATARRVKARRSARQGAKGALPTGELTAGQRGPAIEGAANYDLERCERQQEQRGSGATGRGCLPTRPALQRAGSKSNEAQAQRGADADLTRQCKVLPYVRSTRPGGARDPERGQLHCWHQGTRPMSSCDHGPRLGSHGLHAGKATSQSNGRRTPLHE